MTHFPDDFRGVLEALRERQVKVRVAGTVALAAHGHPRHTKDLDVWIEMDAGNAERMVAVLHDLKMGGLGLIPAALLSENTVVQLDYEPNLINLLTILDGVTFSGAYPRRVIFQLADDASTGGALSGGRPPAGHLGRRPDTHAAAGHEHSPTGREGTQSAVTAHAPGPSTPRAARRTMTDAAFKVVSMKGDLRPEEHSPLKREDVRGFVCPLHARAGATTPLALTAGRASVALRQAARRKGEHAHAADMGVATAGLRTNDHLSVVVACEPRRDDATLQASAPVLVEVLSGSTTHNADHHACTALNGVQTCLIAEQGVRRVGVPQGSGSSWNTGGCGGSNAISLPGLEAAWTVRASDDDARPLDA